MRKTENEYRIDAISVVNFLEQKGYTSKEIKVLCVGLAECIE